MLINFFNEPKLIVLHNVKWFQLFLCIINNSIKHHSFVYIYLNDQSVQFQTIQFDMSCVCSQFKCQTVLFAP